MSKRRETRLDPNKILNPERIRTNLLLASLYLSAFEILKIALIESIKGFFDLSPQEYETQVGVKIDSPDQYALIPSCRWLQEMGALNESEVEEIRKIRDHRNEIAHELPNLLVGEGIEVNASLFQRIRELLRKTDLFWARTNLQFDPQTLNEINIDDIRDEDILSSREILLDMIAKTVADYQRPDKDDAKPKA